MRTVLWGRPLRKWALLAGTASALAFTSKYTTGAVLLSVLVVAAFRHDRAVIERVRVGATAIAVFVVTSLVVMPALVLRTSSVHDALRFQTRVYKQALPGSKNYFGQLWQAQEVGRLVLLLGMVGIVLLLLSARARPVTVGYLVYAVPPVVVLSHYAFQPVRDMLPFAPFLAIGAATTIVQVTRFVGGRVGIPPVLRVTSAIVVAIACCWAPYNHGTRPYVTYQKRLVDTRTVVRRLLLAKVEPGDRVLVARELAFLPTELRGICGHVVVSSQVSPAPVSDYDWVIAGDLDANRFPTPWAKALGDRPAPLVIGSFPMTGKTSRFGLARDLTGIFHISHERVYVFGPADATPRANRAGPCPAAR
jgi:hypothetical protein